MPQSLQIRLLRVLQNQAFYRVGGEESLKVDVRIIAATNKNIELEVDEGTFRKDLFYRLNVVRINIPPLRERIDDIPLLVEYFLRKYDQTNSLAVPPDSMERLQAYSWPGNVRDLEKTIRSAVVMAREKIVSILDCQLRITTALRCFLMDSLLKEGNHLSKLLRMLKMIIIRKCSKQSESGT